MPSERIHVRMRCNQACHYCTRHWSADNPLHVGPDAIAANLQRAVQGGADEIILTGGEPTLLPGLEGVIAFLKNAEVPRVVLETNGTLITAAMARSLADAGLDLARVNVSGWGDELDRVTQDAGGFQRSLLGLKALNDVGITLQVAVALTTSTLPLLAALPGALNALNLTHLEGLWVSVPTDSPSASEVLSLAQAAHALERLDRKARSVGMRLQLNPEAPLRPCMLTPTSRYAHLFSMTRGGRAFEGHTFVDDCGSCLMREACQGLHSDSVARSGLPTLVPITSERMRRRLSSRASLPEQIEREYLTRDIRRGTNGKAQADYVLRINFSCNQACRFCFVSTHLPAASDAKVRAAIAEAGKANARMTFSGGEPCLNPRLSEYIALAREVGARPIELQTNATRLGEVALSESVAAAGVDEVFISLHGSHAELSDGITKSPGTFDETVRGIDVISALVPKTTLHFVICQANAKDLINWVQWVGKRWPDVAINFSFVGFISDVVPRDHHMLPRYSDVLPDLELALTAAQELGLQVGRFHSMCGIPLCLAPARTRAAMDLPDADTALAGEEFVKPAPCRGCAMRAKCFGIRRGYADHYGLDELKPFESAIADA